MVKQCLCATFWSTIQTNKYVVNYKQHSFIEDTRLFIFIFFTVCNKHENVYRGNHFINIWNQHYFRSKFHYTIFHHRHHWIFSIWYPLGADCPVREHILIYHEWEQPGHCRSGTIPVPANSNKSVRGRPGLLRFCSRLLWLDRGCTWSDRPCYMVTMPVW